MNDDYRIGQKNIERSEFVVPAYRVFQVTRKNPAFQEWNTHQDWTGDTKQSSAPPVYETLTVSAHLLQSIDPKTWAFIDFVVDPQQGPIQKLHRVIRGVIEIQEVTAAAPSQFAL